jgi:CMP-N,N'-diacetyllegionaminic acid synthase
MKGLNGLRVLGLVPARGGSTCIPRKNIRMLCGKPLLEYTAECAHRARRLSRIVLSTDDPEIAEVGLRCGLEVPFLRPAHLARNDTPMLPVVQHAVAAMKEAGARFDAVCVLQPTHPLRRPEHIDGCVERLATSGADAVVTVLEVPHEHNPHWVYFQDSNGCLRLSTGEAEPIHGRQALPPAFHREGSVYAVWEELVARRATLYGDRLVGYPVDPSDTVNIDGWEDWRRAESMIEARRTHVRH